MLHYDDGETARVVSTYTRVEDGKKSYIQNLEFVD